MKKYRKLSDVAEIITGKLDSNAAADSGIYPFFTCGAEPLRIHEFAYDMDAILLAGNNAQGNFHCQRFKGKFNAYQRTYIITPKFGYNIDYIFYNLKINLSNFKRLSQGSQTKFLTIHILDSFLIEDLPFSKQIENTKLLSILDKKIEINKQINDNLEKQTKLLYDYWFTQFDFPDENGNPYKSSGGEMVFNEELKRYIPNGWSIETLLNNTISRIIKPGVNIFKEKTYFATADINNKEISSGNKVLYQNRESRANMQPIKSSVWFAKMKNSVKHLFITDNMDFMINEGILSTGFCGLECEKISFEYISSFITSPYFEMAKDILSHGATQEAVNNNDLNFINILIPDRRTLLNFHKITKPIYEQITENICSNRKLIELRDYLLPLLLNGQVTIED
ncbi:restriction endonuclease subunit S [Mesomycoplasma ovipneumoniae]|uniref:restriction endonuclease subunit S n=1 Tax=Mesomycoplasma ovipneumoniae TaxID=29562 RepID=UPI0029644FAC|nr:restriction endonuclease subunit S [Mesomycoplasma ovipneumoniae]MDW2921773.1 restriction endonuclease subunit S [Mesomycoplasma ovipneumoniae]